MNSLFPDIASCSLIKHSEAICGDYCCIVREPDKVTAVLSDGLGSGVKANILATLTAKILSTLIAKNLPLDKCVYTVASTLPMCSERKIAYSTFTVLQLCGDMIYLVQYDNPDAVLLRNGKSVDYRKDVYFYGEKCIYESRFTAKPGDIIVLMSDGIINAGMGKNMSSGWKHEEVTAFLEGWWSEHISPKKMAVSLCEAAEALSLKSVDDDTTVMVCKICEKSTANILIGPPQNPGNDLGVLRSFFEAEGRHIVCGGTTSKMAAAYLGAAVKPLADTATEKVPAMSRIEGVDLVTEGYLTLSETVRIAEGFVSSDPRVIPLNNDGASLMCNMLFEQANEVNIFFGTAENAENAALHADLGSKLLLINKLADLLRQQGKNVKINMC